MYSDDTSGNRSKNGNKFDLRCVSLANLPKHEAQAFTNIHFIARSNGISAKEMSGPIINDLCLLEKGICVHDAFLDTDVLLIAPVICYSVTMSELQNFSTIKVVLL